MKIKILIYIICILTFLGCYNTSNENILFQAIEADVCFDEPNPSIQKAYDVFKDLGFKFLSFPDSGPHQELFGTGFSVELFMDVNSDRDNYDIIVYNWYYSENVCANE